MVIGYIGFSLLVLVQILLFFRAICPSFNYCLRHNLLCASCTRQGYLLEENQLSQNNANGERIEIKICNNELQNEQRNAQ